MKPHDQQTMEQMVELGERIASLAIRINAATQRLSEMIRRFDEAEGWRVDGQSSCAAWLSYKTGMGLSTAYEHVRVARRLAELPQTDAAFAAGKLSYCKVRAMTRVADEQSEGKLVEQAVVMSGAELELCCRGMRLRQEAFGERPVERYLRQRSRADGTVKLEAVVSADEAEVVAKALRQARQQLGGDAGSQKQGDSSAEESGQLDARVQDEERDRQRADALVHLAWSFLSAGSDDTSTGGDRTELLVHLQVNGVGAGQNGGEPNCQATLHESGRWLSREVFERLSCDCSMVVARADEDGELLDVGRSRRTIPPAIRRALLARDRHCAFPGCTHRVYVDAHHLRHWSRGGETKLDNLLTLCTTHHNLVHEGGFSVEQDGTAFTFRSPDGRLLGRAPEPNLEPAPKKRRAQAGAPHMPRPPGARSRRQPRPSPATHRPPLPAELASEVTP